MNKLHHPPSPRSSTWNRGRPGVLCSLRRARRLRLSVRAWAITTYASRYGCKIFNPATLSFQMQYRCCMKVVCNRFCSKVGASEDPFCLDEFSRLFSWASFQTSMHAQRAPPPSLFFSVCDTSPSLSNQGPTRLGTTSFRESWVKLGIIFMKLRLFNGSVNHVRMRSLRLRKVTQWVFHASVKKNRRQDSMQKGR